MAGTSARILIFFVTRVPRICSADNMRCSRDGLTISDATLRNVLGAGGMWQRREVCRRNAGFTRM